MCMDYHVNIEVMQAFAYLLELFGVQKDFALP